jgi:hypothetical protein
VRLPAPLCSSIIVRLRRFGLSPPGARPRDLRIGSGLIEPTESVSSAPTPAEARGETSNASLVAKYRFVSGLLDRRADVAAYGCIDDFGSKMMLGKVRKLSVYGPDSPRIGELTRELSDPWRCNAQVHDILESPLPVVHDAIYSLDTFEYISPSDEDRYLEHLSRSLSRPQDILIIGTAPCTGDDNVAIDAHRVPIANGMTPSQIDRGPPARHRRTGASLKALLEIHFRTVSLFSMTAGVVQAGIDDTGDYLFAICSSKKT